MTERKFKAYGIKPVESELELANAAMNLVGIVMKAAGPGVIKKLSSEQMLELMFTKRVLEARNRGIVSLKLCTDIAVAQMQEDASGPGEKCKTCDKHEECFPEEVDK